MPPGEPLAPVGVVGRELPARRSHDATCQARGAGMLFNFFYSWFSAWDRDDILCEDSVCLVSPGEPELTRLFEATMQEEQSK